MAGKSQQQEYNVTAPIVPEVWNQTEMNAAPQVSSSIPKPL